jgi:hypothetical protein
MNWIIIIIIIIQCLPVNDFLAVVKYFNKLSFYYNFIIIAFLLMTCVMLLDISNYISSLCGWHKNVSGY